MSTPLIYINDIKTITTNEFDDSNLVIKYSNSYAKNIDVTDVSTTSKYSYPSAGTKQLIMSTNVSAFSAIGNQQTNRLRTQIVDVTVHENVSALMPSCFMNCENLTSVTLPYNCREIGEYAFYGCKNLKEINCFSDHTFQVYNIRAHAFEGCDSLNQIHLNLYGTNRETGIGEYAFANCKKLESVSWERSSFMASHMFDGCESLTSITLPNYTSYVYQNTFANLISLSTMTIPNKIWMMNDEMFKGDVNLRSVIINDGDTDDTKSVLDQIGAGVFDGCESLTSITLPKSITEFSQIDPDFLRGSAIKKVIFNGMDDEKFGLVQINKKTIPAIDEYGYISTLKAYQTTIKKLAVDEHIPIIFVTNYDPVNIFAHTGCGHCKNLYYNVTNTQKWKKYIETNKKRYAFVYGAYDNQTELWRIINKHTRSNNPIASYMKYSASNLYAQMHILWIKPDNTVVYDTLTEWDISRDSNARREEKAQKTIDKIEAKIKSSKNTFGEDEIIITVDNSLHKFGSSLSSITFVSKSGTEFIVTNDTNPEPYLPPLVDKQTVDNFKYGIWYYNAQELKAFCDKNHVPIFVEFGSKGCTPCQRFDKEIYHNREFQSWVDSKPYLFCHLEIDDSTESFTDSANCPEAYFVDFQWARKSPEYKSTSIPIFMWYWPKPNGTTVNRLMTYHFNPGQNPPIDAQGLMNKTDEIFAGAQTIDAYQKPKLSNLTFNDNVIGQMYPNQTDDDNGKFFIADEKKAIDKYVGQINIGNISISSIEKNQENIGLPIGTYQYYVFSASQAYAKNLKGIIFKIIKTSEDKTKVDYLYEYQIKSEVEVAPKEFPYDTKIIHSNLNEGMLLQMIEKSEDMNKVMVIFKLRNDENQSQDIETLIKSDEFAEFVKSDDKLFIDIYSNTMLNPNAGPEKDLKSFLENPKTISNVMTYDTTGAKMMVYYLCKSCTTPDFETGKYEADVYQMYDIAGCNIEQIKQKISDAMNSYSINEDDDDDE